MKGSLLISFIIILTITEKSIQSILKNPADKKDLKPEFDNPERNLLVLEHYENRRKDYEAAKCKIYLLFPNSKESIQSQKEFF